MEQSSGNEAKRKTTRGHLVQLTAAKMRDLVFAQEPETQIGSLRDLARVLDVGIVTVQQAARVLEHEGLLYVRRGPGGGYYGTRPNEAALERSLAAYIRAYGSAYDEARDIVSLLNCELIPAAARSSDPQLREELRTLSMRIDHADSEEQRIDFEETLQRFLFRMVERPLFELLTRVTMRLYQLQPKPPLFQGEQGTSSWKAGRHRLIKAILAGDEDLARFEADRNRVELLWHLRQQRGTASKQ